MTLDTLMTHAAAECTDERERYLIMFTQGANGYVCRNQGQTSESHALFHGSYRDCQIWIERRGLAAALRHVMEHRQDVPELTDSQLTPAGILEQLSYIAR